ncbi:hypothetical protein BKA65DRAFT_553376 [Rhexocercosporidium sp. MPI-PUGE-AT-0058]|nr:hypothetical protein BKA65DRAFT_553376 [Rhexocercosporidium sp. MPI-PUGE-AT-0058]
MAARKGGNKGLTAASSLPVVVWDPGSGPHYGHTPSGLAVRGRSGQYLYAYEWGIKVAFAIVIAASGISAIVSLCTKWDNINKKKEQPKDSKA